MGTAAFGSGILKGLDVPDAADLLTGYLDHLGDYDQSIARLAPARQIEALLMLAAGDGVTMRWDPGREQLSIELQEADSRTGVAGALALLAACLPGPADITMLDEGGRSWRYVLAHGEISIRPASVSVDGPLSTLSLSARIRCGCCGQRIAQDSDGDWRDASGRCHCEGDPTLHEPDTPFQ